MKHHIGLNEAQIWWCYDCNIHADDCVEVAARHEQMCRELNQGE